MNLGRVGLATVFQERAKLRCIRELKLPADLFPGITHKVLTVYCNRANVEEPSRLLTQEMRESQMGVGVDTFDRCGTLPDPYQSWKRGQGPSGSFLYLFP